MKYFKRNIMFTEIDLPFRGIFTRDYEVNGKEYELNQFRLGVEFLSKNNSQEINHAAGIDQAKIVMENLLSSARLHINIFAGNFDERICNHENSDYCNFLEQFLYRGGSISVLLNNYQLEKQNRTLELLSIFSASAKYNAKINVKRTIERPYHRGHEIHFTTIDERAFREEYDIINFNARFSFNKPEIVKELDEIFFEIFNNPKSEIINLTTLNFK